MWGRASKTNLLSSLGVLFGALAMLAPLHQVSRVLADDACRVAID